MDKRKERVGQNIKIKKYEDIFENDDSASYKKNTRNGEVFVKACELRDFKNHPFKICGKGINELMESIREHGILSPIIVRPIEGDSEKYEIISGHRRKYCSIELGITDVPVIIRDIDDNEAILAMVDSNIQREDILPSEKAFAYKMKLEAIKRQGERTDLTSGQVVQKLVSSDIIGKESNESGRQIRRYIRLTELTKMLLEAIDKKKLSVNAGVLLSYLNDNEKKMVEDAVKEARRFPTLSQAKRIRELTEKELEVTTEGIIDILFEGKISDKTTTVNFERDEIRKFFPDWYTAKQIEDAIIKILEENKIY